MSIQKPGPGLGALDGKTVVITGASRGIGRAIAIRLGAEGANVTMIARTAEPHPKLPGTIHTAAAEAEAAGGHVMPIVADVRDDRAIADAVEATVSRWGGIDMVVNNAAVIQTQSAEHITMQQFDYMQDINCRGTVLLSTLCLPALRESATAGRNPHILNLSPPLNLASKDIGRFSAYAISKYSTSVYTIGLAQEVAPYGIAVNSLWPSTTINTAAVRNQSALGGAEGVATSRDPFVMADAALLVLTRPAASYTGNLALDEEVLVADGVTDLDQYRAVPGTLPLTPDLFVDL
ncbi:SDR family oxidoreductase [Nocardia sp. NBC_01009]|uniref:SDR family oxidoreductase n=1 Tax=Nocardia sp. NBC_01009 TaxID=2975996 RepID=UPI0038687384|nr:SDR family oxidoreductase [Nocardia sp. NBC_01009]